MLRNLPIVLVLACSVPPPIAHVQPSRPPPPPSAPVEPPVIGEPLTLPALAATKLRMSCVAASAGAAPHGRAKTFDFAAIPLEPVTYGPRIAQRPAGGSVRLARTIRGAVAAQHDRLADCFRSAKGVKLSQPTHGGPYLALKVGMTIDPQGLTREISVVGDRGLAQCVHESLSAIRVNLRVPRETRVTGYIGFRHPLDAKPLAKAPPPPPPVAVAASCVATLDPMPVDTLEVDELGEIDFAPVRGSIRACATYGITKRDIRAMIDSNLGTLRACHVAARARDPKLTGIAKAELVIDEAGRPMHIAVTGDGDYELRSCLVDGLAAVTLGSSPEIVNVNLSFELTKTAPPEHATDPIAAIAARDVDAAAVIYAEQARTARSVDAGCRARTGLVAAYASVPWTVDGRVTAAIAELARFVAAHDRNAQTACLADAVPRLVEIGEWPLVEQARYSVSWQAGGLVEAVARSRELVATFPELERAILPFIADNLLRLDRGEEAKVVYLRILELGGSHEEVEHAAEGYHDAAEREYHIAIDTCAASSVY